MAKRPRAEYAYAQRRAAVIEDVEFLLGHGVGVDDIAPRVGYRDRDSLCTVLHRWGRSDLVERLVRSTTLVE